MASMFGKINLQNELNKERSKRKDIGGSEMLEMVHSLMERDAALEHNIIQKLTSKNSGSDQIDESILEPERIYTLLDIREICIKHRLRFLDSAYFKGDIPYEAIAKVRHFQELLGQELSNFKIVAPSKLFKLEDCEDDPMLFLSIGNQKYYLLHKWGNDLSLSRKLLSYPMRNVQSMLKTLIVFSAVLALIVPDWMLINNFHGQTELITNIWPFRGMFFIWTLFGIGSITTLVCFAFFKNFSDSSWKSHHFNA